MDSFEFDSGAFDEWRLGEEALEARRLSVAQQIGIIERMANERAGRERYVGIREPESTRAVADQTKLAEMGLDAHGSAEFSIGQLPEQFSQLIGASAVQVRLTVGDGTSLVYRPEAIFAFI